MITEQDNTTTASSGPAPTWRWATSTSLRSAIVVALLVVASLLASRPAAASCPGEPVAASISSADVVFVGTVLSTANRDRVAQVRVEEVWKGPALPEQVEVRGTPFPGQGSAASVDQNFRPGVRYLFVPRAGSASPTVNVPVFEDGLCTATQEYNPNLDGLRSASDPDAQGTVHGIGPPSDNRAPVPVLPLAVAVPAAVVVAAALAAVARRAYKLDG